MILFSLSEIALIGLIMSVGGVVQGAVGFGSGLLGVPLLVLCGFSLPEAATINLVSMGALNATGAWQLWSHLKPSELVLPVAVRALAIPCGTYAAHLADFHFDPAQAKQALGVIFAVTVILLWSLRLPPRDHMAVVWQLLIFSCSGFLMGFAAISGATLVIYVNSLTWSASKSRAFLFFTSAVALPVAALAFWIHHGEKILPAAMAALFVMPLILGSLWLGLYLGHQIAKPLFRRITYVLVLLVACAAIVGPLLGGASK